jgi:hypothetical protein
MRFAPDSRYVLVEDGKHGRVTHSANTPEEFAAACFNIVKERVEQGYWYDEWPVPDKPFDVLDADQIASLPEDQQVRAKRKADAYRREVREAQANNDVVKRAKELVAANDQTLIPRVLRPGTPEEKLLGYETNASRVLDQRKDYEYERVDLETLRVP